MMKNPPKSSPDERRQVSYGSFDDVLEDAELLLKGPYITLGNWSLGQILQHLADSVDFTFDGFGFRMNILMRIYGTLFLKKRIIERSFPVGLILPKRAQSLLPADDVDAAEAFADLKRAFARRSSTPTAPMPRRSTPPRRGLHWARWTTSTKTMSVREGSISAWMERPSSRMA